MFGHALTAVIQGTLVGIGFAIAGLPSPVVFGVFAAIAAFIPAAGTGFVLVPAVLYLAVHRPVGLGHLPGRVERAASASRTTSCGPTSRGSAPRSPRSRCSWA